MKRYKCSLDFFARNIPWAICLLAIGIVVAVLFSAPSPPEGFIIGTLAFQFLLMFGIVVVTYFQRTTGVTISDTAITIERKASAVVIDFSDILSIKRVESMRYAFRTFGNGGVFGYTGYYYRKGIGSMRWYCTQRNNYVLIEKTDGKKLVITPDDPDGFMKDIEATNPLLITIGQS